MAVRQGAATLFITGAIVYGCQSVKPPAEQLENVNRLVNERAAVKWDAGRLLASSLPDTQPPQDNLFLQEATQRALSRNLSLVASAENLTLAHAQLLQAGLIQNPTIGQTGATLFPIHPAVGGVSFDVLISQAVNSILTLPNRKAVATLQELQANIDLANQAYLLAQQVDGKYQELIHLQRARRLALRIQDLYARAVRAAEARRKVGVIPTPELNRARLNYQDARRQVQHLATQYDRAAREMNWLMGYSAPPQWHLPPAIIADVGTVPNLPVLDLLERLGLRYRLDLLRANLDRKLGAKGIELARLGMIPQTTIGFDYAQDASHHSFGGPQLQFTLPIFDPGIVAVQSAEAQARKANKLYAALQGQVRQDVRTAYASWRIAADDVNFFRDQLIPQQDENVRLMEMSFRLGNDDLDTLLNVYQSYVTQLQSYEDAVQAYHDSAVALQQAVGLTWDRMLAESGVHPAVKQPATTRSVIIPRPATEPFLEPPATQSATAPLTMESMQ